jgi:uncharacterized protein
VARRRARARLGSDQMIWPHAIDLAIETIESADFLTPQQKCDIPHDNAVRFLRLSEGHAVKIPHTYENPLQLNFRR